MEEEELGGKPTSGNWSGDSGGDGGAGGSGGNVIVSKTCKVYSYNGNLVSEGNCIDALNELSTSVIDMRYFVKCQTPDGNDFIPTYIFAQAGILREVYKLNTWWGEFDWLKPEYFKSLLGEKLNSEELEKAKTGTSKELLDLICIRSETTCDILSYSNPIIRWNAGHRIWSGIYRNFKWNLHS